MWQPDYVTVDQLAAYVRANGDDPDDLPGLEFAPASASRAVDTATLRQFGQADALEYRYYTPVWSRERCRWVADIDDLMTAVGLVVSFDGADDDTFSTTIANPVLLPRNAAQQGRPWERIMLPAASVFSPTTLHWRTPSMRDHLRVLSRPGWTAIPSTIKNATLLQGSRFAARRNAPFGVAGSPDNGDVRLLAQADPDVKVMVRHYRRIWGVV